MAGAPGKTEPPSSSSNNSSSDQHGTRSTSGEPCALPSPDPEEGVLPREVVLVARLSLRALLACALVALKETQAAVHSERALELQLQHTFASLLQAAQAEAERAQVTGTGTGTRDGGTQGTQGTRAPARGAGRGVRLLPLPGSLEEPAECCSDDLLLCVAASLGALCVGQRRAQEALLWGTQPTLLHRLSHAPLRFLSRPSLRRCFVPSLLSMCAGLPAAMAVVARRVSPAFLAAEARELLEQRGAAAGGGAAPVKDQASSGHSAEGRGAGAGYMAGGSVSAEADWRMVRECEELSVGPLLTEDVLMEFAGAVRPCACP